MKEIDAKSVKFATYSDKIRYMIENDYYENIYDYTTSRCGQDLSADLQLRFRIRFLYGGPKFYRTTLCGPTTASIIWSIILTEQRSRRFIWEAGIRAYGDALTRCDDGAAAAAGYADVPECGQKPAGRDGVLFPARDG